MAGVVDDPGADLHLATRGPDQPALPGAVPVPDPDPGRRQHGAVRPDHPRLQPHGLDHLGQRPAADVPRARGRVRRHRGRVRRPLRPPQDPHLDQRRARAAVPAARLLRRPDRGALPHHGRGGDAHHLLRAGRDGDDPAGRAARAADDRERPVRARSPGIVRARVRGAGSADGGPHRRERADHHRGRDLRPGRDPVLDPAARALGAHRPGRQRRSPGGCRGARHVRPAARGPAVHR